MDLPAQADLDSQAAPGARQFVMRGGTLNSSTTPARTGSATDNTTSITPHARSGSVRAVGITTLTTVSLVLLVRFA